MVHFVEAYGEKSIFVISQRDHGNGFGVGLCLKWRYFFIDLCYLYNMVFTEESE